MAPAWELFQLLKAAASPGQLPPLGGAGESENELRLERLGKNHMFDVVPVWRVQVPNLRRYDWTLLAPT